MKTFEFRHADDVDDAIRTACRHRRQVLRGRHQPARPDEDGVETPDVSDRPRPARPDGITDTAGGGVLIGAGVTNSAVANHPLIRTQYPVLSQAILRGATTQLRNMATAGGNLLQRTRCPYFMDPTFSSLRQARSRHGLRRPRGFNREHALFGASDACVAVHPSDMAVALAILDAVGARPADARVAHHSARRFFALPGASGARQHPRAGRTDRRHRTAAVGVRGPLLVSEGSRPAQLRVRPGVRRGRASTSPTA